MRRLRLGTYLKARKAALVSRPDNENANHRHGVYVFGILELLNEGAGFYPASRRISRCFQGEVSVDGSWVLLRQVARALVHLHQGDLPYQTVTFSDNGLRSYLGSC